LRFAQPQEHIGLADLSNLPKPLLVVDDASHMYAHVLAVLRFVDKALVKGDYLIVEDGSLNMLAGRSSMRAARSGRSRPSWPRPVTATRSIAPAATPTATT
jgi:cephalosporin hydroxylase